MRFVLVNMRHLKKLVLEGVRLRIVSSIVSNKLRGEIENSYKSIGYNHNMNV